MLAGNLHVDGVDHCIVEVDLHLDLVRKSEDKDLKLLKEVSFVGRPIERSLFGSCYHLTVYQ